MKTITHACNSAEPVGDAKHRFASEPRSGDVERFIAPRMVAGAPWHMTWRGGCAVACIKTNASVSTDKTP